MRVTYLLAPIEWADIKPHIWYGKRGDPKWCFYCGQQQGPEIEDEPCSARDNPS